MNNNYLHQFYIPIVICLVLKSSHTDILLEGIVPEERNIYEAASKNTFSYIKKFLFEHIKHSVFTINSNNIPFTMMNAADHFSKISNRIFNPLIRTEYHELIRTKYYEEVIVKWPVGQIQVSCYNISDIIYLTYRFIFHPVFVLKFNLQSMHMLDKCKKLNCKSYLFITEWKPDIKGADRNIIMYRFSGYMPSFSLYSQWRKVSLEINIFPYTFILKSSFSVIDHHVIHSLPIPRKKEKTLILMFHLNYYKENLKIYFIQVTKLSQVVINVISVKSHNYLLYDCPNFVVRCKRNFTKRIILSTFQCIMQVLTKYLSQSKNNLSFAYKAARAHTEMHINTDKSTNIKINIPNRNCLKNMCILYIDSKNGQNVNVTVIDVVSSARLVPSCTLAGFSVGSITHGEYKEKFTICDSHERNSYSHNSPLIIVLYWYEDLSDINANFMLSQTECIPVIIDPCVLKYLCIDNACLSHLKSSRDIIEFSYQNPYLTINYIKTKCVILLLESLNVINKLEWESSHFSCHIIVWILDVQNLVSQISLKIPPFPYVSPYQEPKASEKFYEVVTGLLKNNAEHCMDITCDIKTAKVRFLEGKKGKASSSYFQHSGVHFITVIYFEYKDNGWIDIVTKSDSSGISKNMPINTDLVLSLIHRDFAYTQNSMDTVFLSISCPKSDYSTLSSISIILNVSENSGK